MFRVNLCIFFIFVKRTENANGKGQGFVGTWERYTTQERRGIARTLLAHAESQGVAELREEQAPSMAQGFLAHRLQES